MAVTPRRIPVRRKPASDRPAAKRNRAVSVEDEREIWQMWVDGHTQFDIAGAYGISQQAVSHICKLYGELFPVEEQEQVRQVFIAQLSQATAALMPRVRRGDDTAIRTLVKVQERYCRMMGLDTDKVLNIRAAGQQDGQVTYIIEGDPAILDAV